jgi:hypothetical protein
MEGTTEPRDDPERSLLLDRIDVERSRRGTTRAPIA